MPVAPNPMVGNIRQMIKTASPLLAFAVLLPLAACGKADEPAATSERTATAEATAEADGKEIRTEKTVVFKADSNSGEMGIDLPGGTGATLRLPPEVVEKMGADSKLDIDGVGLYPGARVTSMAVASTEKGGTREEKVEFAFSTPDAPATVADWYVAAFREKGHTAARSGTSVSATTREGAQVAIDLTPDGAGTKGRINLVETKKA